MLATLCLGPAAIEDQNCPASPCQSRLISRAFTRIFFQRVKYVNEVRILILSDNLTTHLVIVQF